MYFGVGCNDAAGFRPSADSVWDSCGRQLHFRTAGRANDGHQPSIIERQRRLPTLHAATRIAARATPLRRIGAQRELLIALQTSATRQNALSRLQKKIM